MAGWSMITDGSELDCAKNAQKLEPKKFWVDLESASKGSGIDGQPYKPLEACVKSQPDTLRCLFDRFLCVFLKQINARDSFRPISPMLGNGQCVDFFKLFVVVRENGGYEVLSRNRIWDLVAKECGLDSSYASAVKLVYVKFLDTLQRWFKRIVENKDLSCSLSNSSTDFGGHLMDLQAKFKELLSEISDQNKRDRVNPKSKFTCELNSSDCDDFKSEVTITGDENAVGTEGTMCSGSINRVMKSSAEFEEYKPPNFAKSLVDKKDDELKSVKRGNDNYVNIGVKLDSPSIGEDSISRKRKRECMLSMINWITQIAKDPCDPVIGSLPDKAKWKSYGNDEIWKQVLLVREEIFLKRTLDSSAEQSSWQKIQKMHPCMYEDQLGTGYNLRERLKCGKKLFSGETTTQPSPGSFSSGTQSDFDKSPSHMSKMDDLRNTYSSATDSTDDYLPKHMSVGPNFQAEVPEWSGLITESDSKWLGTRVWPLEKANNKFLIERDPIGKGRQDSCGCQVPGSINCVRFHIAERRYKVKLELGTAFHLWKFDKMGEEVALSWRKDEENKFQEIVRLNPPLEKCFWDQIFKTFTKKSREDLVSYYFNVFVLRRRGNQNRFSPDNIDSDDDEYLEFGSGTIGIGRDKPH